MSKTDFSKTIHINSVFDISSILNGLVKIQQQLQATASVKGKGMLASIELEIDKATRALTQMQNQAQKGFNSTTEVNDFNRQLEKTSNNVMEIYRDLKEVAGLTLSDGAKKLGIELDKIAKSVEKINKDFATSINNALKDSKLPDEIQKGLRTLVESREVSKALYDEQSRQLDKIIAKERALYITEQDRMKLKAKQDSAGKSLGKTSLFSSGRFDVENFSLTRKGYNTALGQAIRATSEKGNIRQTTMIDEKSFTKELNKNYIDTLVQVAIQGKKAADAVNALATAWEGAGLVFNREKLTKFVQEDFNKITFSDKLSAADIKTLAGKAEDIQNYQKNSDVIEKTRQMVILNNQETEALKQQADAARTAAAAQDALGRSANQALGQEKSNIESTISSWEIFRDELNKTAATQREIDAGFSRIVSRLKYFFSAATIFRSLSRAIRQTYTDVKELDKSFAEIAMVTRYSVNEMWQSYEQYAAMANRLGQSTNDVIKASALFYQQGLDTNEALVLTEDTMKLATLAGIDFAEATDLMTAALRGFKLEMTEGAHITDVYSELAAHAAANVQEIAVAMNKTAAIANSAGMSFENTAAFLTQMIEGTQESAANIGTAMKTVIARFTELKENVDASDSEFEDLDYNKVDTALKSVGIQLKDTNGQFRNLDDVFLELSKRWQTLSRNEQRYIATTAAGSRLNVNPLPLVA